MQIIQKIASKLSIIYLTTLVAIIPNFAIAASWKDQPPPRSPILFNTSESERPIKCSETGWNASYSARRFRCFGLNGVSNPRYEIDFQELAPGYGFTTNKSLEKWAQSFNFLKPGRIVGEGTVVTKTGGFPYIKINRDSRECVAFKVQGSYFPSGNKLEGSTIVTGYYCDAEATSLSASEIDSFFRRIGVKGLWQPSAVAGPPIVNSSTSTPSSSSKSTSSSANKSSSVSTSIGDELRELKSLYEQKLIPEDVYKEQVKKVLGQDD